MKKVGDFLDKIGAILREKRLEKGLTLEDVSKKTRLLVPYLRAIEEGNVEFFKNDLSYVSYYVRYYSTELGIDYNSFKADIEATIYEYTKSLDVAEVRRNLEISNKIKDQSQKNSGKRKSVKVQTQRKRKRFDFSMIAFVATALIVVSLLVYVGVRYVPQWLANDPIQEPEPTPNIPDDGNDKDPDPAVPVPPVKEITVTKLNPTTYEIRNWSTDTPVDISLKIVNRSWIQLSVDGKVLDNPVSKIYESGETIHLSESPVANKEVLFHVGYMNNNEVYVNDKRIELDSSIATVQGSAKIYFKFVQDGGSE